MQVSYKILVVIRSMKIKQKKPLSCVWCLLHNFAHSLTLVHMHQTECVLLQTHKWLFFLFQGRRRSLFFNFFGLSLHFFSWTHLLGWTLTRSHKFFFPAHGLLFWDAFLKKRMAPPSWKPEGIAKCRLECCNWVVRN